MRKVKLLILTIMALGMTCVASGQGLKECRALARENYPLVRQFGIIDEVAQYNLSNAARGWIPQISLSAQASYQSASTSYPDAFKQILSGVTPDGKPIQTSEITGLRKDQYKIAIDINQNIWDGGKTRAMREIVESETEEQRRQVEVDIYEMLSRVDDIYFSILLLEGKEERLLNTIALLQSNLEKMRTCLANEVAARSDVEAVEVELLTSMQNLDQTRYAREEYRKMLEILIGRRLGNDKLNLPEMPDIPIVANNADELSRRPELELFNAKITGIGAREKEINSNVIPHFSAFAQGYYGYPGLDMFKSMTSPDWTLNGMAGIRMVWNLTGFNTRRNNLRKLDAQKRQVDIQRGIFLLNSDLSAARESGEIERLRKAMESDEKIAALRCSIRKAAESGLDNGVIDSTDLLRKITEENDAGIALSNRKIELLQAAYRLKRTLNL
ncbi:MAG: TolC family protein [Candidatus Cryptobacteroides sp.]